MDSAAAAVAQGRERERQEEGRSFASECSGQK
jgi:hypothetical protein